MSKEAAKNAGIADRANGSGDLSKTSQPMTNGERNSCQGGYGSDNN